MNGEDSKPSYHGKSREEVLEEIRSYDFMASGARHRGDEESYRDYMRKRDEVIDYARNEFGLTKEDLKKEIFLSHRMA